LLEVVVKMLALVLAELLETEEVDIVTPVIDPTGGRPYGV
jgi:hypothetical protein